MEDHDTKSQIMDAAERLFAESGIAATSLRAITSGAGVNLASVNYHFGSKESLVEATFARRIVPLNEERLRRLDEVLARWEAERPPVEELLEAFLLPTVRIFHDYPHFLKFAGRVFLEPESKLQTWFHSLFAEMARRMSQALQQALPDLPPGEVFWRMHFVIGAMIHTLFKHVDFACAPLGQEMGADKDPLRSVVERLVAFGAAGLRAPVSTTEDVTS